MSIKTITSGLVKINGNTVDVFPASEVDAKRSRAVKVGFEPLEASVTAAGYVSPLPGGITGGDNAREREAFTLHYDAWTEPLTKLAEASKRARRYAFDPDLSTEGNHKKVRAIVEKPLSAFELALSTSYGEFEAGLAKVELLMSEAVQPEPRESFAYLANELRAQEARAAFRAMPEHDRMAPLRSLARRGDLDALEAVCNAVLPLVSEAVQELAYRDFLSEAHAWLPAWLDDARELLHTIAARADGLRGLVAGVLLKGITGVPEIGNPFYFSNMARVRLEQKLRYDLACEVEKQLHADAPEAQDQKRKPKKEPTLVEALMEQRGMEAA